MARMIPPLCSDSAPSGERRLFKKLRDDPDTRHWVALHSLDIRRHVSKVEGEIDMLVFIPDLGIACLEVKGCNVTRQDGKWIYPYETSVEGPFRQASKAMHSLRNYLNERDPSLSSLLFFSGVIFTHVNFNEQSSEWHPWQFISKDQFVRHPISTNLRGMGEQMHAHIRSLSRNAHWYDDRRSRPSQLQIHRIVQILRSNFEYLGSERSDVGAAEDAITRYTDEQIEALDRVQDNDRVVFRGPAGTGKTVLALEAYRRSVANGRRPALLCYNTLLGESLRDSARQACGSGRGAGYAGTFHGLLASVIGKLPEGAKDAQYWNVTLPEAALEKLLDSNEEGLFDALIVDEAQDLLRPPFLDVMDVLLSGGLAGGKWIFFGDFERQAIYGSLGGDLLMQVLKERAPHHASFSLRINCRNAGSIADTLTLASNLAPGYSRVLHDLVGAEVDPVFYQSEEEQRALLLRELRACKESFRARDVVVLSTRSDDRSCAGSIHAASGAASAVHPMRADDDRDHVRFCSVHAFKGLEAPAVILTDIEKLDDDQARALLYVGMSRARIRLIMLMKETCRQAYSDLLEAGLTRNRR